ncbi:MAG: PEP-CTERM sorting domain-containing protein [Methylomonas sp.]|jgi:hypothetical protein
MNFKLKSTLSALLLALINTVPVYAVDSLQVYDLTGTTDNGASVSATLTFDATTDEFIAPSFASVSNETGIYHTYTASNWNGSYLTINDAAVTPPGSPLYVNLVMNTLNLYFQFNDTSGVLSVASPSVVGYYDLKDPFVSTTLTAVPEPETFTMFAIGLLGLGLAHRKMI